MSPPSTSARRAYPAPDRRHLRIYGFDPMHTRLTGRELVVDVPFEDLQPGPSGALVRVVDLDGPTGRYYAPVDLEDPNLLAQQGLKPTESDPQFHQQMVYAVAASVLEQIERALGRRFRFRGTERITMIPHAFVGANAFFDPALGAVLFGYFTADEVDPGPNLPGQPVFTCLSSDIVAHELAHAVVHRLRPRFIDPTNLDVPAFHEAFADLVALFHHFTHVDIVEAFVQDTRTNLRLSNPLVELARQFGYTTGGSGALRSAIDAEPDPKRFRATTEPHDRGSILVAAVFDAFLKSYEGRIADLVRLATNGTGMLPAGHLHPDLVRRVAGEAATAAAHFFRMCVRSFDFLPPVDVTFGDFLRAIVTADRALFPDDGGAMRRNLIEAFRQRGVLPAGVTSLSEDALTLAPASPLQLPGMEQLIEDSVLATTDPTIGSTSRPADDPLESAGSTARERSPSDVRRGAVATALQAWASEHATALGLDPDHGRISVEGFHASVHPAADGQPRFHVVVRVLQRRADLEAAHAASLGPAGLQLWAGTTIIANAAGRVLHLVAKPIAPLPSSGVPDSAGAARLAAILTFVAGAEEMDSGQQWRAQPDWLRARYSIRTMHSDLWEHR